MADLGPKPMRHNSPFTCGDIILTHPALLCLPDRACRQDAADPGDRPYETLTGRRKLDQTHQPPSRLSRWPLRI